MKKLYFTSIIIILLFTFGVSGTKYELEKIDTYPISSAVVKVEFIGDKVFVANEAEGLKVYKKSDVKFTHAIGSFPDYAYDFAVKGDYIYVAANTNGFTIYKMIDNGDKIEFENIFISTFAGFITKVILHGNQAILLSPYGEMFIMRIDDPENPEFIQRIRITESLLISDGEFIEDNILMIADEKIGIFYFERDSEGKYKQVKKLVLEKGVSDIYLYKDEVYLGSSEGIRIYKREKINLYEKLWIPIYLKRISDMVRKDNLIYYLGETDFGIVDVSNSSSPEDIFYVSLGCYSKHIEVINEKEFLICADCQALKRVKLRYKENEK